MRKLSLHRRRSSYPGRRLRVLHVVPALFGAQGAIGGAERYVVELVRALGAHVDVRLLAFGDGRGRADVGGVQIDLIAGRPIRGNAFNRIGAGLLRPLLSADVVHCHQVHVLSTSVLGLLGRIWRTPVAVTDHGGGGWDISRYVSTDRLFQSYLHVSEFSRRLFGQESDPRADVIGGGVRLDTFRMGKWAGSRDRVVFVGRVLPHKGIHDLVEALPAGLSLDVIGPQPDRAYARDLENLAVGRQVHLLGELPDDEMARRVRAALCLVLPSSYESRFHAHTSAPELLGQTLLEGMASGIPVVCTDAGAMPEIVEDGHTGFVVAQNDPGALHDRLERLAIDWELAARLGAAGHKRVSKHFTWEGVARRCLRHYQRLASRR